MHRTYRPTISTYTTMAVEIISIRWWLQLSISATYPSLISQSIKCVVHAKQYRAHSHNKLTTNHRSFVWLQIIIICFCFDVSLMAKLQSNFMFASVQKRERNLWTSSHRACVNEPTRANGRTLISLFLLTRIKNNEHFALVAPRQLIFCSSSPMMARERERERRKATNDKHDPSSGQGAMRCLHHNNNVNFQIVATKSTVTKFHLNNGSAAAATAAMAKHSQIALQVHVRDWDWDWD